MRDRGCARDTMSRSGGRRLGRVLTRPNNGTAGRLLRVAQRAAKRYAMLGLARGSTQPTTYRNRARGVALVSRPSESQRAKSRDLGAAGKIGGELKRPVVSHLGPGSRFARPGPEVSAPNLCARGSGHLAKRTHVAERQQMP